MKQLILTLLLCLSLQGFSQTKLWEKGYDKLADYDRAYCIINADNGNYMAGATAPYYGFTWGGNPFGGAVLIKLTPMGDTIFIKPLGVLGTVKSLTLTDDGNLFAAVLYEDQYVSYPVLVKATLQGQVIWTQSYSSYPCININKIVTTANGGCIVVGNATGIMPGIQQDFFALKADKGGILDWFSHYNTNTTYGSAYNIEKMHNGHYMVSGTSGASVRAVEIDTFGIQYGNFINFYTHPNNKVCLVGLAKQLPNGGFIVSGRFNGSPQSSFLGSYSSNYQQIWGNYEAATSSSGEPFVNTDSSVVVYRFYNNATPKLDRVDKFGNTVWSTLITSSFVSTKSIMGLVGDGNNNAVLVGYYNSVGPTGYDYYFCKIENTGTPYVSGQPVGVKDKFNSYKLTLYPNPATTQIRFNGLQQSGALQLYNMQGQVVLNAAVSANESIDVSGLAKGVYMWKISGVNKLFSGRLVKE